MHVPVLIFFCVLMPLVGMRCALKMLLRFLLPREMSSRIAGLARQPHNDRSQLLQR
jgi:hypothetical protein